MGYTPGRLNRTPTKRGDKGADRTADGSKSARGSETSQAVQACSQIGLRAEVVAVNAAGHGSSLMEPGNMSTGRPDKKVLDALNCLQASKNLNSYVQEKAMHAPQYLYRVELSMVSRLGGGGEEKVVGTTKDLPAGRFGVALPFSSFVLAKGALPRSTWVCDSAGYSKAVTYNTVSVTFSGPGLPDLTVTKTLPGEVSVTLKRLEATVPSREKLLVTTMFDVRPVFPGATRPRHQPLIPFAPSEILDIIREVNLKSDTHAVERAIASNAMSQLNRRAAKTLAHKSLQDVVGKPAPQSVNSFAVLAETNPDAAYVSGYVGVPVNDTRAMRVLHSLRVSQGFKKRERKYAPDTVEPGVKDKNWRSCVRRLKKNALKMGPSSVALVVGACQGTELPKPMRAALKRNLRASSARYVSLRLLKSKYFRPLTFDQNVTVLEVFDNGELPRSLKSKFLKMADVHSPTAYKARSSKNLSKN